MKKLPLEYIQTPKPSNENGDKDFFMEKVQEDENGKESNVLWNKKKWWNKSY